MIRATRLTSVSATKTLFYQLGFSALLLPLASLIAGEPGIIALTPKVVASLAYQSVIVAFASYLAWFWLLTRYLAGRLAVFSFLTPLFGVAFGVVLLGEPLNAAFVGAALLVGAGIVLVNRPTKSPLRSAIRLRSRLRHQRSESAHVRQSARCTQSRVHRRGRRLRQSA